MEKEIIIKNFEEIIEREAKSFGNGSHIIVPFKFKNKKCIIICMEQLK